VLVLRFHDAHVLCRCARVSRAWRRAAGDERLWMWLFRASEFPWPEVQPRSPPPLVLSGHAASLTPY
jgi:hypothetical protein